MRRNFEEEHLKESGSNLESDVDPSQCYSVAAQRPLAAPIAAPILSIFSILSFSSSAVPSSEAPGYYQQCL